MLVEQTNLLGIVTTRKLSKSILEAYLPYLLAARKQGHSAVLFNPAAIHWKSGTVCGVTLANARKETRLKCSNLTIPSVIYNRVPTRTEEKSFAMARFIHRCKLEKIPVFNSSFFSKDVIYQLLRTSKIAPFLPETTRGMEDELLDNYLQRYTQIYLKPVNGSYGRGIIRLQKTLQSHWQMDHGHNSSYFSQRFSSWNELLQHATAKIEGRDFVIQQGIQLKTFRNYPIDFRLHVQRGSTGKWETISCHAQAGKELSVTTDPRSGGQFYPALAVFRHWYGSMGEPRMHKLCQIAMAIADEIQQRFDGLIGELGLDMGIDQNEQVWLFEANSKPAPVNLAGLDSQFDNRLQSAIKTVEFADYLRAGMSRRGGRQR